MYTYIFASRTEILEDRPERAWVLGGCGDENYFTRYFKMQVYISHSFGKVHVLRYGPIYRQP